MECKSDVRQLQKQQQNRSSELLALAAATVAATVAATITATTDEPTTEEPTTEEPTTVFNKENKTTDKII